ncbi:MAG TPA: APC family permease [Methanomassiliicoccales archaeon]|jgi:amino acid transporter
MDKIAIRHKLNSFDVTNIVVGSIIGADVYVATAIGARLLGPASILIWVLAGLMAMVIAISFAYCVMMAPKAGGPYAYVNEVSTPFVGFTVGWSLLLAEWFSLAVFPVAFAQYFVALIPGLGALEQLLLKAVFIVIILFTNLLGVKAAGRINDGLTLAKLGPLLLIIVGGLILMVAQPSLVLGNFTPFATGGTAALGQALVLIFWAYAGFELSTLPADEIEKPERTIPKSIVMGMLIVIAFYLLTNFVVIGLVSQSTLATSASPLIDATSAIFGGGLLALIAVAFVGVGALISITGADESGTIGSSRLAYAMSLDGLLPKAFHLTRGPSNTPYLGLTILCITAFVASAFGGISALINSSVFLLAFTYLATCISAIRLQAKHNEISAKLIGRRIIPLTGSLFCIVLLLLVDPFQIVVSLGLLAVGVPIYTYFSPKKELSEAKAIFMSREARLRRACHQARTFLAFPIHKIKIFHYRRTGHGSALLCGDKAECQENDSCKPI